MFFSLKKYPLHLHVRLRVHPVGRPFDIANFCQLSSCLLNFHELKTGVSGRQHYRRNVKSTVEPAYRPAVGPLFLHSPHLSHSWPERQWRTQWVAWIGPGLPTNLIQNSITILEKMAQMLSFVSAQAEDTANP